MNNFQLFNNEISFAVGDTQEFPKSIGVVEGYAARYFDAANPGTDYNLFGDVHIRIMPGAFDQALIQQKNDVKFFVNHDTNTIPFARTGAGTGRVWLDAHGLKYRFGIPASPQGQNLLTALERKDIVGSSFTGAIGFAKWAKEGTAQIKNIHRFSQLVEISPCYDPAFSATNGLQLLAASLGNEAQRAFEIQQRIELAKRQ